MIWKRWPTCWRRTALAGLLVLAGAAAICRPLHVAAVPADSLSPLRLDGCQRLLVIAPHNDDEVLGCGGVIQAALARGMSVQVVVATNGDGYYLAAAREDRRLRPKAVDYIRLGRMRQSETLGALKQLGVSNRAVSFLGYPDRGLAALWTQSWRASRPFRSKYTRSVRSPYRRTYNPRAVYAGVDLLADLCAVLHQDRPDLVLYPHPNDDHTDHQALSAFCRLALAVVERDEPAYRPTALAYLVHRTGFPEVRGLRLADELSPPEPLFRADREWLRFDLSADQAMLKSQALGQYHSQIALGRKFLYSFARRDEVFARVESAVLPEGSAPDPLAPSLWRGLAGQPIAPVEIDADRDSRTRRTVGAADFTQLYAVRTNDGSLVLCAQTRRKARRSIRYVLRAKAVYADGSVADFAAAYPHGGRHRPRALASGPYVAYVLPAQRIGHPLLLMVSAVSYALGGVAQEVQLDVLDRVAWQLVVPAPAAAHPGPSVPEGAAAAATINPKPLWRTEPQRPAASLP